MKETPIIMSGDHPRKILDGTKTMTRRVIKPQPDLLYGIYGDIIQLYHNRRAEDDQVDIKADTNITKRQLYGWERWQDILTNQIQGFWEKGFRGVVSISRLQDRGEGVFSCLLMPQQQEGNDVNSSASMYGFSRDATSKVNAGEAFGWQPAKQQTIQPQMGDSIRELAGQNVPQREQPQLQQPQFKDYKAREGTYTLGSKEQNSQQETYSKGLENKPTFYIRNMPFSIGQRLWVRETWATMSIFDNRSPSQLDVGTPIGFNDTDWDLLTGCGYDKGKTRPSIHMFRKDSRILLEITEEKAARTKDLTLVEAIAEGYSSVEEANRAFLKLAHLPEGSNGWNWVIFYKLIFCLGN